ncbi:MAG TPA: hypothetical protein VFR14_00920 [Candidatus Limnocylindrales bacterium]|nr:hypothetical protein [Candidatus Limnocylindrales bacterium]
MTLDDDTLRAHVVRRARGAPATDTVVASVMSCIADVEQPAAWRTWLGDRAPAFGAVGLVAVVALVAGIAMVARPGEPGASTQPGPIAGYPERRALTADELARVVAAATPGLWGSGAHVVADVEIVREADPSCVQQPNAVPCPTGYLAGVEPRVGVTESTALAVDSTLSPPFVFQLRREWSGSLFAVGEVVSAPDALTWTLEGLIAHRRTLGTGARPPGEVFLVDAWLVQTDAAYRCPIASGVVDGRFECGAAAWLAPTGDRAVDAPLGSVRVQNAALQLFGRDPAPRQPERAIVAVALEDPVSCFQCPPGGAVRIVARVDPVEVQAQTPTEEGVPPAGSCDATTWSATVISCEAAFRIGSQAGARVERARIWLSTLGAVRSALNPARQVSEPTAEAPVWVIVYDGRWRCCPDAFDEFGNRIPQVTQSRWLVVAESEREGSGFVYLQDWSDRFVPDRLPGR